MSSRIRMIPCEELSFNPKTRHQWQFGDSIFSAIRSAACPIGGRNKATPSFPKTPKKPLRKTIREHTRGCPQKTLKTPKTRQSAEIFPQKIKNPKNTPKIPQKPTRRSPIITQKRWKPWLFCDVFHGCKALSRQPESWLLLFCFAIVCVWPPHAEEDRER